MRLTKAAYRWALLGASVGSALTMTTAAHASASYALPDHYNFDKLGIDIGSLEYERHDTFLTIGDPADGGLAWSFVGHSGSDPYWATIMYWQSPASAGYQTQVKIGGHVTAFVGCGTNNCVNWSGTGATLVKTATNWVYTADDGSVFTFDIRGNISDANTSNPQVYLGRLLSITRPSGAVITINYNSDNSIRSVVSSLGYALKYSASQISLVNLANHTCDATVTTCDSVDASVSITIVNGIRQITDSAGETWQYQIGPIPSYVDPLNTNDYSNRDGLDFFKSPAGYQVSISYDNAGRITTFVDNRGTWTFTYDVSLYLAEHGSGPGTVTVKDPSGQIYYTAHAGGYSYAGPWVDYVQDALGNKTQFGAQTNLTISGMGGVGYVRLQTLTKPEGNVRTWAYDSRGNITSITDTPKTSGPTPITISATYPSTCTSPASCNKPTSETDANGHTTNYTYNSTHGGLLSAMGPAPVANGARPLKLVTWVQKTPYYRNPSGALTASTTPIWVKSTETKCQTLAGTNPSPTCDASAPQTVTTYQYGADGTANSLWPHGVAVSSGGTTLRTCYTYDALGNKVSETKPNANLATCP
jgi:YD repeat-containing protein